MKTELLERRSFMLNHYGKFFSLKDAVTDTAQKFGVKTSILYVDWNRRSSWLKQILSLKDNSDLIRQLLLEVFRVLREIEKFGSVADNDNCRLGAHKLRLNGLFKLIDLFRSYDNEALKERIEKLEKKAAGGMFIP